LASSTSGVPGVYAVNSAFQNLDFVEDLKIKFLIFEVFAISDVISRIYI